MMRYLGWKMGEIFPVDTDHLIVARLLGGLSHLALWRDMTCIVLDQYLDLHLRVVDPPLHRCLVRDLLNPKDKHTK